MNFLIRNILIYTLSVIGILAMPTESATSPQDLLEKSPRHHQWVDLANSSGHTISSFVVFPESKNNADIVVIIHENRGLTDWVRWVGDEIAKNGNFAICPDFLTESGPDGGRTDSFNSSDDARTAIYQLDSEQITLNLKTVVEYARGLPSTTQKVSIMGFCWGGAQTFRYATNDNSIVSAFVFYGSPPEKSAMSRINCPVYGFYGEKDQRINATIESTEIAMDTLGKIYRPVIYEGVGHAFLKRGFGDNVSRIEKRANQAAWSRLFSLLKPAQ